jgi:predicted sugar kinase
MAITNTWGVIQMDAYPELEGNVNVVFTLHWTLSATDGTYSGRVYGTVGVSLEEDATFTPYADLTKAQVIGWVKAALGEEQVATYESNVAQQIANQITPPVVTPTLPWIE